MKGTLVTVTKDHATGLTYGIYLIRYEKRLWIATFDIEHGVIVQMQGVTLSEERVPGHIQDAVRQWLL